MLRKIVFLLCATSAVLAIPRKLSISIHYFSLVCSRVVWTQVDPFERIYKRNLIILSRFISLSCAGKFNLPLGLHPHRYSIECRMGNWYITEFEWSYNLSYNQQAKESTCDDRSSFVQCRTQTEYIQLQKGVILYYRQPFAVAFHLHFPKFKPSFIYNRIFLL